MKILHVIPSFWPGSRYGGPIAAALGLTRELARQGHDVSVMTTNLDGPRVLDVPLGHPVPLDGIRIWYFSVVPPRWWYFSPPLGRALMNQVKDYDVVHIHSIFLWPTTIASWWCRHYGIPYIVRPHGVLDPVCLMKPYERWSASAVSRVKKRVYLRTLGTLDLGRASAIHFTTDAEMEAARPLGLQAPGFVVPPGVEMKQTGRGSSFPSLREAYSQLEGRKIVLFLSRLDPIKGLDLLIPAIAELAGERKDFALVVAGSGTRAYEARMMAMIHRFGIQDRTIFLGFIEGEAKWRLFQEADAFVLPSYHENFGMAVVEALAAGVPVVISSRVGIHRDVAAAGAGLVTDLDSKQIAATLGQLLGDGDMRKEMGNRGRLLARERFAWESVGKEMVRVYEEVIGRTGLMEAGARPDVLLRTDR